MAETESSEELEHFTNSSTDVLVPWKPVSPNQHTYIGVYLIIVGILGTFDNALVVAMFHRFRVLLTRSNLLLLNLCISDLGICLLGGFPFSGVSSLAGKWLYGDFGCQYYAFIGFVMGIANVTTLAVIAIDRYIVTCRQDIRGRLTHGHYYQVIIFIWCWAMFWSICPLLGWASYSFEPSVTTCTLNWQNNDLGYKWFISLLAVLGYCVPLLLTSVCYFKTSRFLQKKKQSGESFSYPNYWATEKNITKMGIVLILTFIFCWTSYAVVCLWTVFDHPYTVPLVLTLLPPLMAKASPVLNPIIYFYMHPRLKKGMIATLTCCFREPPPELLELPETKSMTDQHK
ncbi:hypothetical protein SK128_022518 [Halocaridina rubra]|uniref:G-protein coupled receptors family 1 profile domain-containing protein n=1 Tax=Halocaridina rubra TaxID=373956 RepID=A0AAN8XK25_HALRR